MQSHVPVTAAATAIAIIDSEEAWRDKVKTKDKTDNHHSDVLL